MDAAEQNHYLSKLTYQNTKAFVPKPTKGKVVKVYDGDTVWLACYVAGEPARVCIRMKGYDTAEVRTHDSVEKVAACGARDDLASKVLNKTVNVVVDGSDKYGRLIATLYLDEEDVNAYMLTKWGVPYFGATKPSVDWGEVPR